MSLYFGMLITAMVTNSPTPLSTRLCRMFEDNYGYVQEQKDGVLKIVLEIDCEHLGDTIDVFDSLELYTAIAVMAVPRFGPPKYSHFSRLPSLLQDLPAMYPLGHQSATKIHTPCALNSPPSQIHPANGSGDNAQKPLVLGLPVSRLRTQQAMVTRVSQIWVVYEGFRCGNGSSRKGLVTLDKDGHDYITSHEVIQCILTCQHMLYREEIDRKYHYSLQDLEKGVFQPFVENDKCYRLCKIRRHIES